MTVSIERIDGLIALGRQALAAGAAADRALLEQFLGGARQLVAELYPGNPRAHLFDGESASAREEAGRGVAILEEIRVEIEYAGAFGH